MFVFLCIIRFQLVAENTNSGTHKPDDFMSWEPTNLSWRFYDAMNFIQIGNIWPGAQTAGNGGEDTARGPPIVVAKDMALSTDSLVEAQTMT